jgi:trehalose synthase
MRERLVGLEDYEPFVGAETVDRIQKKAHGLRELHVANINSTYYGGGVAELLRSLTLLMNDVGIKTGWRVIQGAPDFFSITKKMHNALQGGDINLSCRKCDIYEDIIFENALRNHLDHHNMVIVHDPQPLPMINHYDKKGPWIWRCHVDLSQPNRELWKYLSSYIEKYDAVVLTLEDYKQPLKTPQRFFMPAIDPFSIL